uniref:CASP-like protein n=1 Tax=Lotus japonicus TaxID=34305 RepID=I3SVG0_LOTJA|nr:unknown [Lotus japonicus]
MAVSKSEIKDMDMPPETSEGAVVVLLRQWEREVLLERGLLWLRVIAFVSSFISFITMASNKHGGWKDFDKYEEFRHLLATAIISSLYTGYQVFRQVQELYTEINLLRPRSAVLITFSFVGDQVMAYLMMSSVSSGIPMTSGMRSVEDNIFTDSLAAAISMSFFAFLCLALSALISGYKLSTQIYS